MFIPDNMKDHDIALFLQVVFPAEHFTYAQAEAITMTIDDMMERNSYGTRDAQVEDHDNCYWASYNCDAYGGVISALDLDQLCDAFTSLSAAYPHALFDIMIEDEDYGQFQYVFLFHDGQCERDSSTMLEPSLTRFLMGEKPVDRILHFKATTAQMKKIYALFSAEGIDMGNTQEDCLSQFPTDNN